MNKEETEFEDYDQTIERVINHQRWLWERAQGKPLTQPQERELAQLKLLILDRKTIPSGRVLWMGGTEIAKIREVSQFACAATKIETVYDIVDSLWCLLNGTGIGGKPVVGSLTGFARPIKDIQIIRSQKKIGEKGHPDNIEIWNPETKVWVIKVGDSSEAWAKASGKLIAGKYPAKKLVIDFSEVRAAGSRLSNYGWISSGDENVSEAFFQITKIMNRKAGSLLTKIDILDVMNWLGTSLSSRRAAEIMIVDYGSNEWEEFAIAKKNYWLTGNPQRGSSNNSLAFYKKPSIEELKYIFNIMSETGGAEPGFLNANEAERRAPWFVAPNPCCEILLPNKGFCNLYEIDISKFRGDTYGLHEAARLAARANYRQTCVNLKDGVLQEAWHLNNDFLRLCGIGLTGIARRSDMIDHDYRQLERVVVNATYSIADELDMPRPKNITCIKPSGCRPWDALTTTNNGIFTLEELFNKHEINKEWCNYQGSEKAIQDNKENNIAKTYDNGVAPVYRIKLNHGFELESTANHPWFVKERYTRNAHTKIKEINDWVETIELKEGDILDIKLGIYNKTEHYALKTLNFAKLRYYGNCNVDIKEPSHMNSDLAWLLGYLWGDGCVDKHNGGYRISFSDQYLINIEKAKSILLDQFGVEGRVYPDSQNRDMWSLEVNHMAFYNWLEQNNINKYENNSIDVIPLCVRQSAQEDIIAFIAGLIDSNGSIYPTHGTKQLKVMITQKDDMFSKHVQHVGWAVGLQFGKSFNQHGENFQKKKHLHLMQLNGWTTKTAAEMLFKHCNKYTIAIKNYTNNQYNFLLDNQILGKVVSVEYVGEMPTFDIEVENEHYYYAGAVKSHNTLSKLMDTTEGLHKPLGKYIINNIIFVKTDPLLEKLHEAGYHIFDHPTRQGESLVSFPVSYEDIEFDKVELSNGEVIEVNLESAIDQLNRYKMLQNNWTHQNSSCTISYTPDETPEIIKWMHDNWDNGIVGVSFMYRIDPLATPESSGFPYLPQQCITKSKYDEYVSKIKPLFFGSINSIETDLGADCSGGACPVR